VTCTARLPTKYTLFPYTTLFRSDRTDAVVAVITDEAIAATHSFQAYCTMLSAKEALGVYAVAANWKDPDHVKATLMDIRKKYPRSEEHTSELQSRENLVCRLLLE